jgi:tRNA (guanine37-N1)-methyltransferase
MVMIDAVARMVQGVLKNAESGETESLSHHLLEYPQYSRPEVWQGKRVPEILLSGDHAKVEKWRQEQAIKRTKERRPDLYAKWRESSGI